MRQLQQTGWMHNRLRMITASFLTKDLLLHWHHGERWFLQHLIDGDFASNNGGWQWAASTGTDAQPYFRVFNPTTQGERFDPEGSLFVNGFQNWLMYLINIFIRHIYGKAIQKGIQLPLLITNKHGCGQLRCLRTQRDKYFVIMFIKLH